VRAVLVPANSDQSAGSLRVGRAITRDAADSERINAAIRGSWQGQARHMANALGAAPVFGVTGEPTAFLSAGERNSHMGVPDGNPITAAVKRTRA
jgi:hypothetical protein